MPRNQDACIRRRHSAPVLRGENMVPVRQTAQHYIGPADIGRNRQTGLDPVKKRNIALGQGRTGIDPCIHFDRRASLRRMSWRLRRALALAPAISTGQKTPSQRFPVADGKLHSVPRFADLSGHKQNHENKMDQPACVLVGERGFEPPTSSSRTKRATELRYSPNVEKSITHDRGFEQIDSCGGGEGVGSPALDAGRTLA